MYCNKCGRLSEDQAKACLFCGNGFNESEPASEVIPNNQIAYEINEPENTPSPKYIKTGWMLIAGAVAIVTLAVVLILK